MTSEANNVMTWQSNLDPALLRRLLHPLTRPGVLRQAQGRRILERLHHMAAGLPLLDQLSWYLATVGDAATGRGPIVYALSAQPDTLPVRETASAAEPRPVVVARVPPAVSPAAAQPPLARPIPLSQTERAAVDTPRPAEGNPAPAPRPPGRPASPPAGHAERTASPVDTLALAAPPTPGSGPNGRERSSFAPVRPAVPDAPDPPETPLRIVLPPAQRRPTLAQSRPAAEPIASQRAALRAVTPAPRAEDRDVTAAGSPEHRAPGALTPRLRAAAPAEVPTPRPLVAARPVAAPTAPAVLPLRRVLEMPKRARATHPVVSAPLPAIVATAPAALPVASQARALQDAGKRAEPLTRRASESATAVASPGPLQPAQGADTPVIAITEGEAGRLADRVYDLLARRIATERGRRGW
jgi:hypothetical protein